MSIVYHYNRRLKPVAFLGTHRCNVCSTFSHFYLVRAKKSVRLLLMPLLNWDEKLLMMCEKCKAYRNIGIEEFNKILKLPDTYVEKELIIRKEWYEYTIIWILLVILLSASFLIYLLVRR